MNEKTNDPKTLTLDALKNAVGGSAAAFRCITRLQPAGGPGDKVFPPTYEGGRYAVERRRLPDRSDPVDCVLMDSVQSQANRMELALLEAHGRGEIRIPLISVDFAGHGLLKDLRITSLEAPHRIADALLRDSLSDGRPFRSSERGKKLDHADNSNATWLFEVCPTALIFGMWDSTGPRGGLGAKFARALVSEIVGLDMVHGVKTSSRIDPAAIIKDAGPLFRTANGGWTLSVGEAQKSGGKAVLYKQLKGKDVLWDPEKDKGKIPDQGRPSVANHGNVTPTIGEGGVTISEALQTTVLSLPALRRLHFPVENGQRGQTDPAARSTLAALALCAATLARELGCDLRSRCLLVPTQATVWELLDRPGDKSQTFSLTGKQAEQLLKDAVDAAEGVGLPWMGQELQLTPSPELVSLVKKSQELAAGEVEGEDA